MCVASCVLVCTPVVGSTNWMEWFTDSCVQPAACQYVLQWWDQQTGWSGSQIHVCSRLRVSMYSSGGINKLDGVVHRFMCVASCVLVCTPVVGSTNWMEWFTDSCVQPAACQYVLQWWDQQTGWSGAHIHVCSRLRVSMYSSGGINKLDGVVHRFMCVAGCVLVCTPVVGSTNWMEWCTDSCVQPAACQYVLQWWDKQTGWSGAQNHVCSRLRVSMYSSGGINKLDGVVHRFMCVAGCVLVCTPVVGSTNWMEWCTDSCVQPAACQYVLQWWDQQTGWSGAHIHVCSRLCVSMNSSGGINKRDGVVHRFMCVAGCVLVCTQVVWSTNWMKWFTDSCVQPAACQYVLQWWDKQTGWSGSQIHVCSRLCVSMYSSGGINTLDGVVHRFMCVAGCVLVCTPVVGSTNWMEWFTDSCVQPAACQYVLQWWDQRTGWIGSQNHVCSRLRVSMYSSGGINELDGVVHRFMCVAGCVLVCTPVVGSTNWMEWFTDSCVQPAACQYVLQWWDQRTGWSGSQNHVCSRLRVSMYSSGGINELDGVVYRIMCVAGCVLVCTPVVGSTNWMEWFTDSCVQPAACQYVLQWWDQRTGWSGSQIHVCSRLRVSMYSSGGINKLDGVVHRFMCVAGCVLVCTPVVGSTHWMEWFTDSCVQPAACQYVLQWWDQRTGWSGSQIHVCSRLRVSMYSSGGINELDGLVHRIMFVAGCVLVCTPVVGSTNWMDFAQIHVCSRLRVSMYSSGGINKLDGVVHRFMCVAGCVLVCTPVVGSTNWMEWCTDSCLQPAACQYVLQWWDQQTGWICAQIHVCSRLRVSMYSSGGINKLDGVVHRFMCVAGCVLVCTPVVGSTNWMEWCTDSCVQPAACQYVLQWWDQQTGWSGAQIHVCSRLRVSMYSSGGINKLDGVVHRFMCVAGCVLVCTPVVGSTNWMEWFTDSCVQPAACQYVLQWWDQQTGWICAQIHVCSRLRVSMYSSGGINKLDGVVHRFMCVAGCVLVCTPVVGSTNWMEWCTDSCVQPAACQYVLQWWDQQTGWSGSQIHVCSRLRVSMYSSGGINKLDGVVHRFVCVAGCVLVCTPVVGSTNWMEWFTDSCVQPAACQYVLQWWDQQTGWSGSQIHVCSRLRVSMYSSGGINKLDGVVHRFMCVAGCVLVCTPVVGSTNWMEWFTYSCVQPAACQYVLQWWDQQTGWSGSQIHVCSRLRVSMYSSGGINKLDGVVHRFMCVAGCVLVCTPVVGSTNWMEWFTDSCVQPAACQYVLQWWDQQTGWSGSQIHVCSRLRVSMYSSGGINKLDGVVHRFMCVAGCVLVCTPVVGSTNWMEWFTDSCVQPAACQYVLQWWDQQTGWSGSQIHVCSRLRVSMYSSGGINNTGWSGSQIHVCSRLRVSMYSSGGINKLDGVVHRFMCVAGCVLVCTPVVGSTHWMEWLHRFMCVAGCVLVCTPVVGSTNWMEWFTDSCVQPAACQYVLQWWDQQTGWSGSQIHVCSRLRVSMYSSGGINTLDGVVHRFMCVAGCVLVCTPVVGSTNWMEWFTDSCVQPAACQYVLQWWDQRTGWSGSQNHVCSRLRVSMYSSGGINELDGVVHRIMCVAGCVLVCTPVVGSTNWMEWCTDSCVQPAACQYVLQWWDQQTGWSGAHIHVCSRLRVSMYSSGGINKLDGVVHRFMCVAGCVLVCTPVVGPTNWMKWFTDSCVQPASCQYVLQWWDKQTGWSGSQIHVCSRLRVSMYSSGGINKLDGVVHRFMCVAGCVLVCTPVVGYWMEWSQIHVCSRLRVSMYSRWDQRTGWSGSQIHVCSRLRVSMYSSGGINKLDGVVHRFMCVAGCVLVCTPVVGSTNWMEWFTDSCVQPAACQYVLQWWDQQTGWSGSQIHVCSRLRVSMYSSGGINKLDGVVHRFMCVAGCVLVCTPVVGSTNWMKWFTDSCVQPAACQYVLQWWDQQTGWSGSQIHVCSRLRVSMYSSGGINKLDGVVHRFMCVAGCVLVCTPVVGSTNWMEWFTDSCVQPAACQYVLQWWDQQTGWSGSQIHVCSRLRVSMYSSGGINKLDGVVHRFMCVAGCVLVCTPVVGSTNWMEWFTDSCVQPAACQYVLQWWDQHTGWSGSQIHVCSRLRVSMYSSGGINELDGVVHRFMCVAGCVLVCTPVVGSTNWMEWCTDSCVQPAACQYVLQWWGQQTG